MAQRNEAGGKVEVGTQDRGRVAGAEAIIASKESGREECVARGVHSLFWHLSAMEKGQPGPSRDRE